MTDEVCGCHLQWVQAYPATFHTFETLKQGRYLVMMGFLLLSELLTFLLCFVKKKKILISRKYKFTLENSESKNTGKEVKDKKPQNP